MIFNRPRLRKSYPENFADATWSQIIEACQTRKVPNTWKVADQKAMDIGGTAYLIDIIGKDHDTYSDGSGKAPLTFQMHDLYSDTYPMNLIVGNAGGWDSCDARTTFSPRILAKMQDEVIAAIKKVNKLTSEGERSTGIITSSDSLFLLSEIEVFGSAKYSVSGEGSQYAYYVMGNSKIKTQNGSAAGWWERSPYNKGNQRFCGITPTGGAAYDYSNSFFGVSFGFCF